MKIAYGSDLHLEFGQFDIKNKESAKVLILAGDICIANRYEDRYDEFFTNCSKEFSEVIYIMGNHEHYKGDIAITYGLLQQKLCKFKNIHLLDTESITIDDVTFVCGTMWTDMNKENPDTIYSIRYMMNDYRNIDNSNKIVTYNVPVYKKNLDGEYAVDENGMMIQVAIVKKERPGQFIPTDSIEFHKKFLEHLKSEVKDNFSKKYVVVTHHAPSKLSTKPMYRDDFTVNGAYSSDLSDIMLDNPQIKVWIHGHTHDKFDYMLGNTRILCNPRGYFGYEPDSMDFDLKYFEI